MVLSWDALTKAAVEGDGRSHRLLAVLYDGTYDRMAAGAEEKKVVPAHCCCAGLGKGGCGEQRKSML